MNGVWMGVEDLRLAANVKNLVTYPCATPRESLEKKDVRTYTCCQQYSYVHDTHTLPVANNSFRASTKVRTHVEVQVVLYFDRTLVATLATFSADRRQIKQTMGGRKQAAKLIGDDRSEFQLVFFQKCFLHHRLRIMYPWSCVKTISFDRGVDIFPVSLVFAIACCWLSFSEFASS